MPTVGVTHHVEIGGHYYMVRPGSYLKKPAPQFGARFSTGDPDWNNFSMWQHWSQKCFIGGFDQDVWADDAMYDEGIGLDTTDHEKVTITRDLARGTGSNWGLSSATTAATRGGRFIVYNGKLYSYTFPSDFVEARLWEYVPGTDGWTRITSLDAKNITVMCATVFDGKLWLAGVDSVTYKPKIVYDDGTLTTWTVQSIATLPTAVKDDASGKYAIRAIGSFAQKMYVCFGVQVWRMKDDQSWDGNTVFYKANASSSSNYINSLEVHLGFLYMLSQNGHVHRTDGNSSFDIWNWDGQTQGLSIRSFDGRLFIMTFEYTNTTDAGQSVLYQMSGSAMTQLKRFGDTTQATRIPTMRVYDRKMFYGASNLLGFGARPGFGVAVYDPIEDAHSVMCTNSDTVTYARGSTPFPNYIVDDIFFFGGFLFIYLRGHGGFKTPYKYRDRQAGLRKYDVTPAAGSVLPQNGGWLTTSLYDAGAAGVKKLWRKIVVDVATPTSTALVAEYSTNNGTSWVTAGTVTAVAGRRDVAFFLNNVISTSLKLRFTLRTTSATATPIFYGFVVSYLPTIEPNWMWSFTIVLSEVQVLLDGTQANVNTESELTFLGTTWRTKQLIHFTDAEGVSWESAGGPGVLLYDMTVALRDLTQPLEGEVTVTLLEAVETY